MRTLWSFGRLVIEDGGLHCSSWDRRSAADAQLAASAAGLHRAWRDVQFPVLVMPRRSFSHDLASPDRTCSIRLAPRKIRKSIHILLPVSSLKEGCIEGCRLTVWTFPHGNHCRTTLKQGRPCYRAPSVEKVCLGRCDAYMLSCKHSF